MNKFNPIIFVADNPGMDLLEALQKANDHGRALAIKDVRDAMYHQCFECNNDEDMQRWDGGNWIRYKLFEEVMDRVSKGEE